MLTERRGRPVRTLWVAVLAAVLAAGTGSRVAAEENIDLGEMAAALAFPVITGGFPGSTLESTNGDIVIPAPTAATLITVSNGKSDAVVLQLDVIDGERWQSLSFECLLTGRETTTFVFVSDGNDGSNLFVECRDPFSWGDRNVRRFTNVQNGILFVAAADPAGDGKTLSEDVLFGDAIVVDQESDQAYSFGGIPFQAGSGSNDGDRVYRFDGSEYAKWPAVIATNFLAPTDSVNAELILFTLDGTIGTTPAPRVKLGGMVFNDDEEYLDFQYEFDSFDVVSLTELDPNFRFTTRTSLGLGSVSGHLTLKPQPIGTLEHDVHDAAFGNADSVRKRPVHCWIVQNTDGTFVPADEPVPGTPGGDLATEPDPLGGTPMRTHAAWGRPCSQSNTPLRPFLGDLDPVLSADPDL